jgi:hypothetical protein
MTQPKKYLKRIIDGSFLIYCIKKPFREYYNKESVEFEGGGTLQILNLTESKGRSPRCDIVLYDEEAEAEEDAYMAAESILDGSDIGLTIHASTPVKASKFEENHDKLRIRETITGHELIFARNYDEIYFLVDTPAKRAKYAEKKRTWPGWYFRQEYECSFESPMGAVFQNVIYDPYPEWLMEKIKHQHLCSGVDWNPVSGHWIASGRWTDDFMGFVVEEEHDLGQGYAVDMNMGQFQSIAQRGALGNHLTMEEGGINEEYIKWFRKMLGETRFGWSDQNYHYEEWDSAGVNKFQAVTYLIQNGITIYVDRQRFPNLAKMIEDCQWDPDSEQPKIKKNPASSPHALDAFLHAISKLNRGGGTMELVRFYD